MDFTNDFFIQAQGCIERVFRAKREEIKALHGKVKVEFKADHTVVTELDKQLEQDLKEALKSFDSNIGFEGEEFGIEGNRNTYWLIDPIDGTENFVRGLPFVRNMATLVDGGKPVFTVVYKPITDEVFVAAEGEGAYRNGVPIRVSDRQLDRAWVEMSVRSEPAAFELMGALSKSINSFKNTGEFTYIAQGMTDGYIGYKNGGGPWDYAPRAVLIQEAGGRVANIGSDTYDMRNNDFIMANSAIFDDLMGLVVAATNRE